MTILYVDNTPIMLQILKENVTKAFPHADVQAFLSAEPALFYAQKMVEKFFITQGCKAMNNCFVVKGNLCQTQSPNELALHENVLFVQKGVAKGIFDTLPEEYDCRSMITAMH